ncbi:MAG: glycogen debranching enzyme family protein [Clostridia bacterium]|nr:glycogen debranching enzyme family protein [Clostridia bacterium]MBP3657374.1 glycogen debranching enzyme family protein [Clostridia bacterium]
MRFVYGRQQMTSLERAQENGFLLGNGLGGYMALSAAGSVSRCDQGVLVAAEAAPNVRFALVHRLSETLRIGRERVCLSAQMFEDGTQEDGWKHLSSFVYDNAPCWTYHVRGVQVTRSAAMAYGENTAAVRYTIENRSGAACSLSVTPMFQFVPKSEACTRRTAAEYDTGCVRCGGRAVYITGSGQQRRIRTRWEQLSYPHDACDGRPAKGLAFSPVCIDSVRVAPGETAVMEIVFSDSPSAASCAEIFDGMAARCAALEAQCSLTDPVARQLAVSADAFITRRDSTGGSTIVAGYPFFGDWGRDTMIALPGCVLACGRTEEAASILRTFLAYERDGLVPNLFPEGSQEPMYNTADAALLLINVIHMYHERTGDDAFVREAWPVMERIVRAYREGTRHGIAMDSDGLIRAGHGLDQVTWMDVRVGEILPTPRHGKPVEINAYWYSALRIMERFAPLCGADGSGYAALAKKAKASFIRAFYRKKEGYLRDVVSGTAADDQIRCNQIWAVTMPFTMLTPEQERSVVDCVYRHLYTPCGLRTLSPEDPQFHPAYGGPQAERDMAYHQGTVWPFPLGAYYLAQLKVQGQTREAAACVRRMLEPMEAMLIEGCAGQLPEIYDGLTPGRSQGCFAQAWSVGEMLRVYEALERIERG